MPVAAGVDVVRCAACRGRTQGARQAVWYAGAAPALITALKDRGRRDLAPVLASVIAAHVPAPPAGATLVPVPLGGLRARRRGYNQAALLADALAGAWRRPVAHALSRVREGPPQRGAARTARIRQAAGAYAPRAGVAPVRFPVLVDDVHTTGATLAACAAALHRAGAVRVGAVCVARAGSGAPRGGTMGV